MSTPSPCLGNEFALNADHCITVANAKAQTWPYACAQSTANGLHTDPTGGLWTRPISPVAGSQHDRSTTTISPVGQQPLFQTAGTTLNLTAPTNPPCLNYYALVLATYTVSATFAPTDTTLNLGVYLGQSNTPTFSAYDPVATDSSSEQSLFTTQNASLTGTAALQVTVAAGGAAVPVYGRWALSWYCRSQGCSGGTGPTVVDWSIDYTWLMWPWGS